LLYFNILGDLEMLHDGRSCTPSAPKVRAVLALLLMRAKHIVTMDSLIEELWGETPPRSSTTTTQTYVYQLRKLFEQHGLVAEDGGELLVTRPPGYVLRVCPEQIDANVAERLIMQGRDDLRQGCAAEAATKLRRAVAMWNGPVLAGVAVGALLEPHVVRLGETYIRALELLVDADLAQGRHRELIPELRTLVATYPLNEWFHTRLIEALSRSGRRAEALLAYHNVRKILSDELGLEPATELQRLQSDVLNGGIQAS
jgi:DNA-binding SARP family transcriptional activator